MTEERKQELRRLLEEAMEELEIQSSFGQQPPLSVDEYGKHLRERWASYSKESRLVLDFRPEIAGDEAKSKLRDFIRSELGQFIKDDNTLTASYYVLGGSSDGFHLDRLLDQLLKIAIARGAEGAVLAFDSCSKNTPASMQCAALLEGIKIKNAIQVFRGIQLISVPDSQSVGSIYVPRIPLRGVSEDFFLSQTLLIIDFSISPMFHKPILPAAFRSDFSQKKQPFCVDVRGRDLLGFNETEFFRRFCQALSLICNFPVQIPMKWDLIAEDKLFNVREGPGTAHWTYPILNLFGKSIEVGEAEIDEAKHLYNILDKKSEITEKLRIPIDRWIKSKTPERDVDKMIDLGIALEAMYVPDSREGEVRFKLAVRAAWYLGKDKENRDDLLKKFKQIYDARSKSVHNGRLGRTVKFGEERIPTSLFIERTQRLCRKSLLKMLEGPKIPDKDYWDSLVLGGDS